MQVNSEYLEKLLKRPDELAHNKKGKKWEEEVDYKRITYYNSKGEEITREQWLNAIGEIEPDGINNIYHPKRKRKFSLLKD